MAWMSGIEIPAGVGWTALLTAYGRAQESREEEGLFSDPFAAMFIDAVSGAATAGSDDLPRLGPAVDDGSSTLWNAWRFYFSQRTPFYDQRILEAVKDGCEQVVLLAAGLDSRAFRLGLAENVTVFELDQPAVLNFKEAVLSRHGASPTCQRIPLATDLRADWPEVLHTAGFDASLRTVWVAEGLLMYLSRSDADQLLARVTALSAPGSRFATEYFSRAWHDADVANDTLDAQDWAAWNAVRRAFLYGPMDDSPEDWLAGDRWTRGEVTTLAGLGNRNHRPVPPEFARPGAPQVWLLEGLYKGRVP
jgi:methyltransferase (TIGR00027 family)